LKRDTFLEVITIPSNIYKSKRTGFYYYQRYLKDKNGKPVIDRNGVRKKIHRSLKTDDKNMAVLKKARLDKQFAGLLYEDMKYSGNYTDSRIKEYLKLRNQQRARGVRAKKTYQNDAYVMRKFGRYCWENLGSRSYLIEISRSNLIDYFNYLQNLTTNDGFLKANTIRVHYRTLSSFFAFAVDNTWIRANPCTGLGKLLPKPTRRENYPKVDTEHGLTEWMMILNHVSEQMRSSEYNYFYYVIWILMRTGMRLGEACALSWSQPGEDEKSFAHIEKLADGDHQIRIRFKGKERTIPVERSLIEMVKRIPENSEYIDRKTGEVTCIKKIFLFESYLCPGQPITHGCIQRKFKAMMQSLNLPLSYTPHSLRHSFISMLVRNEAPVPWIGKFVGHSSLHITDRYIHVEKDSLKKLLTRID